MVANGWALSCPVIFWWGQKQAFTQKNPQWLIKGEERGRREKNKSNTNMFICPCWTNPFAFICFRLTPPDRCMHLPLQLKYETSDFISDNSFQVGVVQWKKKIRENSVAKSKQYLFFSKGRKTSKPKHIQLVFFPLPSKMTTMFEFKNPC